MESNIIILNPPRRAKRKEVNQETPKIPKAPKQETTQQETSIRLVDKETGLRMQREERGRWITVGEFMKEKKLPRMTVLNRIKRGKYIVIYDDKKCNRYGHPYLIWIPSATPNDPAATPNGVANLNLPNVKPELATPTPDATPNDVANPNTIPSVIPNELDDKEKEYQLRKMIREMPEMKRKRDIENCDRLEREGKGKWIPLSIIAKMFEIPYNTTKRRAKKVYEWPQKKEKGKTYCFIIDEKLIQDVDKYCNKIKDQKEVILPTKIIIPRYRLTKLLVYGKLDQEKYKELTGLKVNTKNYELEIGVPLEKIELYSIRPLD